MKKVLPLLLWCVAALPGLAQSGAAALRVEPAQPRPGDRLSVTYDPKDTPLAGAGAIEAVAFLYDGARLKAYDVPLAREGAVLKGTIQTGAATDGVVFTFRSEGVEDHNGKQGYFTYLYDSKGQPVAGARGGLALYKMATDLTVARTERNPAQVFDLLKAEQAAYPDSGAVFLTANFYMLVEQDKEKGLPLVLARLDSLARKKNPTVKELEALYTGYLLFKEEKAGPYKAMLLQRFPKGTLAETDLLLKISKEKNPGKKLALLQQFEKDFPKSLFLESSYSSTAIAYLQGQDIAGLRKFFEARGSRTPASTYNTIAHKLYEAGQALPLAESLAGQGVAKARAELVQPSVEQPDHLTEKQWRQEREKILSATLATYGITLDEQGKAEEAHTALAEAVALQKSADAEVNERFVALLVKTKRYREALAAGDKLIPEGKGTRKMKDDIRLAYIAANGNEKGYDRYLAALEAPAREKMKKELARKMISEPAPAFSLQDLKGNTISSESLKGKTVVVDFWATWCGPCVASMPGMQQAVARYKNDPTVQFLFINSWQREDDKLELVRDFLAKKKYDFTVPMDVDNQVIGAYKVDGIPTKFVIDPQGNIRFKSVGFEGGPDALVEELSMMIDLAAGKGQ